MMKTISSIKSFVFLLFSVISLSSCELFIIEPNPQNTPTNNFELLWKEVNNRYTYFEYKNIDWNESYQKYKARVNDSMSDEELFDVLAEMLNDLKDGHTNLISDFDVSRNWSWYLDYPQNYNESIVERNYLGKDYQITGPFKNKLLSGEIAYVQYASFMSIADSTHLDLLMDRYASAKGMIIDIRNNTGGAVAMVNMLTSRFVTKDQTLGYERYKRSAKANDFTDYFPFYIKKASKTFQKPVIILTNRQVYSAANMFASVMSELENVTLVGDQTGGGGGAPFSGELLNGWKYRFSGTQFLNLKKEHVEKGVTPDIFVSLRPEDEAQGKDTMIDYATGYLSKQ